MKVVHPGPEASADAATRDQKPRAPHTPGPWEAEGDCLVGVLIDGRRDWTLVASVGGDTADEQAANLRLITTAPELLDFAKWCLSSRFDSRNIGILARSVIRKATGEA